MRVVTNVFKRVLIVAEDEVTRYLIKRLSQTQLVFKEVLSVHTLAEALCVIQRSRPDLIFLDTSLPDFLAITALKQLLEANARCAVVILTPPDDVTAGTEALESGAQDYLVKGRFGAVLLERTLRYAVARKLFEQRVSTLEQRLHQITNSKQDAIIILNEQLKIEWLNPTAYHLLDVKNEQALGTELACWVIPDQQRAFKHELSRCIGASAGQNLLNGARPPTEWTLGQHSTQFAITAWQEEDGNHRLLAIGRDITEERLQRQALDRSLRVEAAVLRIQQLRDQPLSLNEKLTAAKDIITTLCEDCCAEQISPVFLVRQDEQRAYSVPASADTSLLAQDLALLLLNDRTTVESDAPKRISILLAADSGSSQAVMMSFFQEPNALCRHGPTYCLGLLQTAISAVVTSALQQANINRLSRALEQTPVGTLITDNRGHILYSNEALRQMSGYSASELQGRTPQLFKSGETSQVIYRELWQTILAGRVWRGEIRNRRKDGSLCWERVTIAPVQGGDGLPENFIAIRENIERRMRDEQQLIELATLDPLTRLPNRSLLLDRLQQAVIRSHRDRSPLVVVLIDLDQFKLLNDHHGHQAGDRLLQAVAQRLSGLVRQEDSIGRLGGDEFVLILQGVEPPEKLTELLQHYLEVLSEPYALAELSVCITCSLGVASCEGDDQDANELYRRADLAMYQAKNEGGNQYQFYTAAMDAQLNHKVWLRQAFKVALVNRQFSLHYQPQVNLTTGILVGLEALIRWQHPDKGLLMPDAFIPYAEETGAIIEIGEWAIDEVCRQLRAWLDSGFEPPRVAVNISARQLADPQLLNTILDTLKRHQIAPELLDIELTESAVMQSPESAITLLHQLRAAGISVSGDDFGTGYSSLSYLKALPFTRLKIDHSFVIDLERDRESRTIAAMVISLAHALNLKVLAEGVETEGQWRMLQRMGCDEMQGYLCSKPLAADACVSFCQPKLLVSPTLINKGEQPGLLLVDDEPGVLRALQRVLRREGYAVYSAETPSEALRILEQHEIGVVMSDQRMPEMSGTELLVIIKARYPDTVRLVLSGYTDLETIIESINKGFIFKFLAKPWDDDLLRQHIKEAFHFYRMLRHDAQLEQGIT